MKLYIYPGFDIDKFREANSHFKVRQLRPTSKLRPKLGIEVTAKWPCPDCGEPMLDGSYCGAYCVTPSCVIAEMKALAKTKIRRGK